MIHKVEKEFAGRQLSLETGRMAKQAHGSVFLQFGETSILATVVESKEPKSGANFLPLFVDYRERAYAGGKVPGGFFKREGRPGDREVLCARLIDRPIRPLFPDGYRNDIIVMITVLSSDQENPADMLGLLGASAALSLSKIPVTERVAAVRVGYIDSQYVLNPTFMQQEESSLNLVVAGTRDAIVMVEGGADELPADVVLGGLKFAHTGINQLLDMVEELSTAAVPKRDWQPVDDEDPELRKKVVAKVEGPIAELLNIADKAERESRYHDLVAETLEEFSEEFPEQEGAIGKLVHEIEKAKIRAMILEDGRRIDGRKLDEIRDITCEVQVLPRVHGSALFTRGQTQALAAITLGTAVDSQVIDNIEQPEYRKKFMLHYNFPSFSVGEAGIPRGPGRREIGHGMLAERAIKPVIKIDDDFPYTIRLVSDILESNGSSSMASVCGGSLALMDAGVPLKRPVAGIAMGLIHEEGKGTAILSDILGAEDHLGDMDFKIAGSSEGITAFQLDSKIGGISLEVLERAMNQAVQGYRHILGIMEQTLAESRPDISPYAPRIITIKIDPEKIREVIGPGGKMIRSITEESGAKIDIEDDGTVTIASVDEEACRKAISRIEDITKDPEVGRIYESEVKNVTSFGAFVEFLPGKEGLVHISELEEGHVKDIESVVKVGDRFPVKLVAIDKQGRVRLSKVAAQREMSHKGQQQD
ncbi:MAG: polyribonucleotide nucleotidyltransferase [Candidatus Glassbacteria bacterium]|nr:polyribonucleotide nucleotidyltransferase [Candidatus Glassbacteria bacterium]